MRLLTLMLFGSSVLAGCANPINEVTAKRYYAAGESALQQGDLRTARENFRRAFINTQIGNLGPEYESQAAAKLARVEGNLCEYDEADKTFQYALSAQEKIPGVKPFATFPTRLELAQLSFDTDHFDRAAIYYEKAFEVGGATLESRMPAGYADLLDDYAVALTAIGRAADAEAARIRATSMRQRATGSTPNAVKSRADYVPYPKSCK